jgi:hypothetical protein
MQVEHFTCSSTGWQESSCQIIWALTGRSTGTNSRCRTPQQTDQRIATMMTMGQGDTKCRRSSGVRHGRQFSSACLRLNA